MDTRDLSQLINEFVNTGIIPTKPYAMDEVEKLLNVKTETVRRLIKSGKLRATYTGKGYLILGDNILEYLKNNEGRMQGKWNYAPRIKRRIENPDGEANTK